MSEPNTAWDVFFDPEGDNPLQLDEEEAKLLKTAILDLNYEELYKPLWRRHVEFQKSVNRFYIITVALQLILIAILLMKWTW